MIIPFFIPHAGCVHRCVFCDQKRITGTAVAPDPKDIPVVIESYLASRPSRKPAEVAFFGGSFTALPDRVQEAYLAPVRPFRASGSISSIRISTRPDCIDPHILALLKNHDVSTVELGVQSMDDGVLAASGRGHASGDTITAVARLRSAGFRVGCQLMPGLPGDSPACFRKTVAATISLAPDLVRLYPALVLKGTPLEILYRRGEYLPLSLDEAVTWCASAVVAFEQAGIQVARVGLQAGESLADPGAVAAGPWHPAFGQLVRSTIMLERMRAALTVRDVRNPVLAVHPRDLASTVGQHRRNIQELVEEFRLDGLRVIADSDLAQGTVRFIGCAGD